MPLALQERYSQLSTLWPLRRYSIRSKVGTLNYFPMIQVAELVLAQLAKRDVSGSKVHICRAGCVTVLVSAALWSRSMFISRYRRKLASRHRSLRWERFLATKAVSESEESTHSQPEATNGAETTMAVIEDALEHWSNGSEQDALALTDVGLCFINTKVFSKQATLVHALLLSCKGQAYLKTPGSHAACLSVACKFLTESVQEASQLIRVAAPSRRCSDLMKQAALCCSSGLAQISLLCSSVDSTLKDLLANASVAAQALAGSTCIELRAQSALALVFAEAGRDRFAELDAFGT